MALTCWGIIVEKNNIFVFSNHGALMRAGVILYTVKKILQLLHYILKPEHAFSGSFQKEFHGMTGSVHWHWMAWQAVFTGTAWCDRHHSLAFHDMTGIIHWHCLAWQYAQSEGCQPWLRWSCEMQHRRALPEMSRIHYVFDLRLISAQVYSETFYCCQILCDFPHILWCGPIWAHNPQFKKLSSPGSDSARL